MTARADAAGHIDVFIESGSRRVFAIAAALRDPEVLVTPPGGWSPRYATRRIGWHVLDHLREIEPG